MNLDIALQPAPLHAAAAISLLDVDDLAVAYTSGRIAHRVVQGVSFSIARGEVLALVGEPGSGKTTTTQAVLGLLPPNCRIERGAIRLDGTDMARWLEKRLVGLRGARISLIPQDSTTLLNPVRTVGAQIAEILEVYSERDRDRFRTACWTCCAASGRNPRRCGRVNIRTSSQAVCARAC